MLFRQDNFNIRKKISYEVWKTRVDRLDRQPVTIRLSVETVVGSSAVPRRRGCVLSVSGTTRRENHSNNKPAVHSQSASERESPVKVYVVVMWHVVDDIGDSPMEHPSATGLYRSITHHIPLT